MTPQYSISVIVAKKCAGRALVVLAMSYFKINYLPLPNVAIDTKGHIYTSLNEKSVIVKDDVRSALVKMVEKTVGPDEISETELC